MNADLRDAFSRQAAYCDALGSPFTAFVCRVLGEKLDTSLGLRRAAAELAGRCDARRGAAPGLRRAEPSRARRFCGAGGRSIRRKPCRAPKPFGAASKPPSPSMTLRLAAFLDSPPQTNEIGRSAALLFGHAEIAKRTGLPLALLETGASAGLNLLFDRYAFEFGSFRWGNLESPVKIRCEWRGGTIDLPGTVAVSDRRGCDLKPIDASDLDARARMLAYIWPDQFERLARAEAALEMAARRRPSRRSDRRRNVPCAGTGCRCAGADHGARSYDFLDVPSGTDKSGDQRHDRAGGGRGDDDGSVRLAKDGRRNGRDSRRRDAAIALAARASRRRCSRSSTFTGGGLSGGAWRVEGRSCAFPPESGTRRGGSQMTRLRHVSFLF